MKTAYLLACTLTLLVLGCNRQTSSAEPQPPRTGQSKTVSDGQNTWNLGAAKIDGTNVPLSNISIRVITNSAPK